MNATQLIDGLKKDPKSLDAMLNEAAKQLLKVAFFKANREMDVATAAILKSALDARGGIVATKKVDEKNFESTLTVTLDCHADLASLTMAALRRRGVIVAQNGKTVTVGATKDDADVIVEKLGSVDGITIKKTTAKS